MNGCVYDQWFITIWILEQSINHLYIIGEIRHFRLFHLKATCLTWVLVIRMLSWNRIIHCFDGTRSMSRRQLIYATRCASYATKVIILWDNWNCWNFIRRLHATLLVFENLLILSTMVLVYNFALMPKFLKVLWPMFFYCK